MLFLNITRFVVSRVHRTAVASKITVRASSLKSYSYLARGVVDDIMVAKAITFENGSKSLGA